MKYLTWLIEDDPAAADVIDAADSEQWSGTHGHDAVAKALAQLAAEQPSPPATLPEAFDAVAMPFDSLERILVDEQEVSINTKATLAWELAGASLAYLWRLALDEPAAWTRFTDYVANPA